MDQARFNPRQLARFLGDRVSRLWRSPPSPTRCAQPPAREPKRPLYVTCEGATLRLDGERLVVTQAGETLAAAPLDEVGEVVLVGSAHITTPALHALLRAGVSVAWHSTSGWFLGHTASFDPPGLDRRIAQLRTAAEPARALAVARQLVSTKLEGQRLLLRRAGVGRLELCRLERLAFAAGRAEDIDELRGLEGAGAAFYFAAIPKLVRGRGTPFADTFPGRRQRPATDPLNAALSFAYALLCRVTTVALAKHGLDVRLGFLHAPRAGKPALALDLMEPWRPLLADRAVFSAINRGELSTTGFTSNGDSLLMDRAAKRALVAAFERRLDGTIHHPALDSPVPWRAVPSLQAQLLGDWLTGARADLPQPRPR